MRSGHAAAFFTVALGVPLIVAMIFIVVAEALVPSGTWPGLMESVRGTRRAVARSRRYSQISRIAVRHGLGPYLRGPRRGPAAADGQAGPGGRAALARSVRQALEEAGVTFVKLGQLLSTRRDLIPEEFITELARLQDQAEPVPWGQIEEVLAQSLGRPADEVFAELRPEPAAAASIGQVHKARLRSGSGSGPGEQVAVKVQRPDIRATVERDLDIVLRMAARLEDRTRWARSLGTLSLARGFADSLREELDFRVEARNVAALTATWPDRQRAAPGGVAVVIPAVDEPLSTEFVLVTGWLDGVSLRTAGPLIDERGLDRAQLARSLLHGLLYQITEGGVHATRIRATSCCWPTAAWACWTWARSAASTPSSGRRSRNCCSRWGAVTRLRCAMPCWTCSPALTRSTSSNSSALSASSWPSTSRAVRPRPSTCSPTWSG